jgi:hypothetical protein
MGMEVPRARQFSRVLEGIKKYERSRQEFVERRAILETSSTDPRKWKTMLEEDIVASYQAENIHYHHHFHV